MDSFNKKCSLGRQAVILEVRDTLVTLDIIILILHRGYRLYHFKEK